MQQRARVWRRPSTSSTQASSWEATASLMPEGTWRTRDMVARCKVGATFSGSFRPCVLGVRFRHIPPATTAPLRAVCCPVPGTATHTSGDVEEAWTGCGAGQRNTTCFRRLFHEGLGDDSGSTASSATGPGRWRTPSGKGGNSSCTAPWSRFSGSWKFRCRRPRGQAHGTRRRAH